MTSFPGCTFPAPGAKELHTDLFAGAVDDCDFPKLHSGQLVGFTSSQHTIIIDAEFNMKTWWQSGMVFGSGDKAFQRLRRRRVDGFYTSLAPLSSDQG